MGTGRAALVGESASRLEMLAPQPGQRATIGVADTESVVVPA